MTKTLQQFTPLTANTTSTSFFSSSLQVEACPNGSVVVGLEYKKAEDADTPAWHKLVCSPVLPELNFTNQYCHYSSEFITGMLNCTKEEYLVGVRWNSSSIKTGSVRINAKCCSKTQQFMTPTYSMGY
ncbi:uncharacterized protein LOC126993893 [Eriocheir sinensis]|uniref:uncharacterized protein LOC126993893 n=1 Tax=Eriocheir sinensis TaxID=95602 RepID=UPI0021CA530A|nr:uncharacterized protein LOC126993893 [Eriocheir sinensis]